MEEVKQEIRHPLKRKIFILLSCIALVFLASSFSYYLFISQELTRQISYYSDLSVQEIIQSTDVFLQQTQNTLLEDYSQLNQISELLPGAEKPVLSPLDTIRLTQLLNDLLYKTSYTNWCAAVSVSGETVISQRILHNTSYSISDKLASYQPMFARNQGEVMWLACDDDSVSLLKALYNPARLTICGYLVINLKADYLISSVFSDIDLATVGQFILFDSSGVPMLSNDTALLDDAAALDALHSDPDRYQIHGASLEKTGLTFEHIVDLNVAQSNLRHRIFTFVCVCVLCLVIQLTIISFLFHSIRRSVVSLVGGIERISQGDFTHPIVLDTDDEFSYIGQRINRMGVRLDALIRRETQNEKLRQEIRYQMLESKYAALQSQLTPHFLFNVLESINSTAKLSGSLETSDLVCKLARLLRSNLERNRKSTRVEEEVRYIQTYIALYDKIYQGRFQAEYDIRMDVRDCVVPTFILQPIVENALVHGLKNTTRQGRICISCYPFNSNIILSVYDNGCGIDEETLTRLNEPGEASGTDESSGSIGLQNIRNRIHLFYGERYGIHIASVKNRFTLVELLLPRVEETAQSEEVGHVPDHDC